MKFATSNLIRHITCTTIVCVCGGGISKLWIAYRVKKYIKIRRRLKKEQFVKRRVYLKNQNDKHKLCKNWMKYLQEMRLFDTVVKQNGTLWSEACQYWDQETGSESILASEFQKFCIQSNLLKYV